MLTREETFRDFVIFHRESIHTPCWPVSRNEKGTSDYSQTENLDKQNKKSDEMEQDDINNKTRCVCETQMPPIMANSIDGLDKDKDKYFDTSKKILSQEMTMCNMETLISYFL